MVHLSTWTDIQTLGRSWLTPLDEVAEKVAQAEKDLGDTTEPLDNLQTRRDFLLDDFLPGLLNEVDEAAVVARYLSELPVAEALAALPGELGNVLRRLENLDKQIWSFITEEDNRSDLRDLQSRIADARDELDGVADALREHVDYERNSR